MSRLRPISRAVPALLLVALGTPPLEPPADAGAEGQRPWPAIGTGHSSRVAVAERVEAGRASLRAAPSPRTGGAPPAGAKAAAILGGGRYAAGSTAPSRPWPRRVATAETLFGSPAFARPPPHTPPPAL